jgi:acetyltransferase-like isoleucine patch superfamily enzyme
VPSAESRFLIVKHLLKAAQSFFRTIEFAVRFRGSVNVDATTWIGRKGTLRVTGGGSITIGKRCEIHDYAMVLTYGGRIVIGDDCSINPFSIIYGHGGVTIGDGVRIAAHTVLIPANHNRGDDDRPLHLSGVTALGIHIEDHVWIGAGCRILDGVTVGKNSVIGAGSVVTRSIPANSTAAGVPARIIEER